MAHILELVSLTKQFNGNTIVSSVDLQISKNEFITLLGPSGCGKTTLLRMIGGFETPTSGDILFNGISINNIPAHKRAVNTVFQKYALFPHMNIFENIAFGLKIRKIPPNIIKEKVANMLCLVRLSGYEERYPQSLSGGQQQRVAIARALVNEPSVLLLDEPLGALDLKLRQDMQKELKAIQRELGITFIFVTHDQEEALSMSDRIVVLNQGKVAQLGSPTEIYNDPENAFVADFIGESNILPAKMKKEFLVEFLGKEFECVDKGFGSQEVEVVLRPEDITIINYDADAKLWGIIKNSIFLGVHYEITLLVNNTTEMIVHSTDNRKEEEKISLIFDADDIHVMRKYDAS